MPRRNVTGEAKRYAHSRYALYIKQSPGADVIGLKWNSFFVCVDSRCFL